MLHAAFSCFLNAVKFTRKYDNSKFPGYSLKIKEIKLRVWGKCGIIMIYSFYGFCFRLAETLDAFTIVAGYR